MKHIFLPALLLLFVLGCSKFESEYAINCELLPRFSGDRVILVSDYKGDIIGQFSATDGATTFSGNLPVTDPDAPDHYDLHLIDTSDCSISIYSFLDVPNGAKVFPDAVRNEGIYYFDAYSSILIEGIQSLDSLSWIGIQPPDISFFAAAEQAVHLGFYRTRNQGALLHLRANGSTEFRTLHVPATALGDSSTHVHWQDFVPEVNPVAIELPNNKKIEHLEVDAMTPDLKYHTKIKFNNAFDSDITPLFTPLPGNFAYRIRIRYWDDTMEKIFLPGEPLRFEASNFSIREADMTGRTVNIETEGDVDLLRLEFFNFRQSPDAQYCLTSWEIAGTPASFKNRTLPDLDSWLPAGLNKTVFFNSATATACQFDGHNYPQIREGFPWKSTEPFAVARSGYRAVRKDF